MYFIQNVVNTDTGIRTYINFRSGKFSRLKTIAKMQSRIFSDTVAPFVIKYQDVLEGSQLDTQIRTSQHTQQKLVKVVTTDVLDFVKNWRRTGESTFKIISSLEGNDCAY